MSNPATYQGFRAAGGRLAEEPLAHLDFHRSNLLGESVFAIHAFDKAHAVMLTEEGIISRATGAAILGAFRRMERRVSSRRVPGPTAACIRASTI